jgi:intracellular septation protein
MNEMKLKRGHKQLLELLPLVAFLIGYLMKGMVWATGSLMIATVMVMGLIYAVDRKLSKAQKIGLVLVLFFGGLTVFFNNPAYLVAKVSVINALFGIVLLAGYFFKRMFIKDLMEEAVALPDHAWMTLTLRWAGFFFFLAALNLVVYFNFSEKIWVAFKLGGMFGLTLLFAFANAPFMAKHMIEAKLEEAPKPSGDG